MDVIYLLPGRGKEVSKELMVVLAMPAQTLFVILVGQLHSLVAKGFLMILSRPNSLWCLSISFRSLRDFPTCFLSTCIHGHVLEEATNQNQLFYCYV